MFNFFKKKSIPTGAEKMVEMINEQCCAWFGIPIQPPPKVIVYEAENTPVAIYNYKADTILVYGAKNVTEGVLAHEVAHSVVYKYGKISEKMHEILAGYAEFKITKVLK